MNSESIASDAAAPIETSPLVLPLKENGKSTGQWSLTVHPSHLALADTPGAQPYVILRKEFKKPGFFMEGMRVLSVDVPRKIIFKLTPEGVAAVADWIGKPFLAALYLKRRYAWVLPWAILWVIGSVLTLLPVPPGSKVTPHFDWISFLLGSVLLVACLFAKWRPHPILFLVDSFWFSLIAINLTAGVVYGRNKAWLLMVVVMFWMAVTGLKYYRRFRGVKIEPLKK
jgi:hypothetical protein